MGSGWLWFGWGLAVLLFGADLLVRGAARLAADFGIPPLIIGLTVVAFGTSAPELAVSIKSAYTGQADMAIGNVVGSNIFNVLFILGLAALIRPLVVSQQLVRQEVPLMIAVSVLVLLLAVDGKIGRADGALLVFGLFAYVGFLIRQSRRESAAVQAEYASEYGDRTGTRLGNAVRIVAGLALLVMGSRWMIDGAVTLAHQFAVSPLVVGLTIVAAGTSLPEVATSIIASIRGERDIAVGNVVGSNLFNMMSVLGLTAVLAPHGISVPPAALRFDIPIMIAVAVACLPVFFTGYLIARWEAAMFFGYYFAYTLYLVLSAGHSNNLHWFTSAMLWFAIPLSGLTLLIVSARSLWQRPGGESSPPASHDKGES
jgi:cation:H+ antiporter